MSLVTLLPIFTPIFEKVIDSIFGGNSEESLKAKLELHKRSIEIEGALQEALIKQSTEQLKINANEAQHSSVFVAGWRPFIGWTGGVGVLISLIIVTVNWLLTITGHPNYPLPDFSFLWPIITGMLGLGGMRTYEKMKGVGSTNFNINQRY